MSKITQIFDAITSIISAEFPNSTYSYLTNPYIIESNDDLTLRRGVGFYIGQGQNKNRAISCIISLERTITITQTVKFYGTSLDKNFKDDSVKTILEDQFKIIKLLENAPQDSANGIDKLIFTNDNGIEFVFGNGEESTENFLMIRSQFSLEYLENLGV